MLEGEPRERFPRRLAATAGRQACQPRRACPSARHAPPCPLRRPAGRRLRHHAPARADPCDARLLRKAGPRRPHRPTASELIAAIRPTQLPGPRRTRRQAAMGKGGLRSRRLSLSAGGQLRRSSASPTSTPAAPRATMFLRRVAWLHWRRAEADCSIAHSAASATTGSSSPICRPTARSSSASPLLPAAIRQLRIIRFTPIRLIGDPANISRKPASSRLSKSASLRRGHFCARQEGAVGLGRLGEAVPRAHRQAIVAAVDAVPHRLAILVRDRTRMLDRQIGNAGPRIDPPRRDDRPGRAGCDAPRAAPAMLLGRSVGLELERGHDDPEEQPVAMGPRQQIAVLALPADPGRRGERLLHHRRGVDKHFQLARRSIDDESRQRLQALLDRLVIVAALGVGRDPPASRPRRPTPADRSRGRSSSPAR